MVFLLKRVVTRTVCVPSRRYRTRRISHHVCGRHSIVLRCDNALTAGVVTASQHKLDRPGSTPTSTIQTTVSYLQSCAAAIHLWCSSRRFQLNSAKKELIYFGSRANLQKIANSDLSLLIDGNVIHRVDSVRDLGVTLESELMLQRHVNKVVSLCFHHIRRLKQVCKLLRPSVATTLISAFVLNRLDYCNAIFVGLPKTTIAPLQCAQNAAARLVAQLGSRDHVSNALYDLHWLPVQQRITYKLTSYYMEETEALQASKCLSI